MPFRIRWTYFADTWPNYMKVLAVASQSPTCLREHSGDFFRLEQLNFLLLVNHGVTIGHYLLFVASI